MRRRGQQSADLLVVNARVITLDPARPSAEAIAIRAGRVLAVGSLAELRAVVGRRTEIVDAAGGVALPAFHDAHLHLLSYARAGARVDCRGSRSIAELGAALAARARDLPPASWVRGAGYDEGCLSEGRHPDRLDLDAAVPHHPVRLQHRGLHLDVLNTLALRRLGLYAAAPEVERDPASGEPTGRLYHAAALLRGRLDRCDEDELAQDVRLAGERLLAWGVTSVQDASATNGVAEWELFHRLAARGALPLRLFMLPGAHHWEAVLAGRPPSARVRLGPVKVMLDEATTDPAAVRATVAAVHRAGRAVALHAVSEAEVAIALSVLETTFPRYPRRAPDRIEHGGVIADAWLGDLRRLGVTIVGQPALVYERGDAYRAEYPPEVHGWLHRAGSLVRAGVRYAASSDAPLTEPIPALGRYAARRRRTRDGTVLGATEALTLAETLVAFTCAPAEAVRELALGRLLPGAPADVVVLDAVALDPPTVEAAQGTVRLTVMDGAIVYCSRR